MGVLKKGFSGLFATANNKGQYFL